VVDEQRVDGRAGDGPDDLGGGLDVEAEPELLTAVLRES
jgi:hypothetical protein